MRRANCPSAAEAEAAEAAAAALAVQCSAGASEAVKREQLAEAGIRLLESPAACGRLVDSLLFLDDDYRDSGSGGSGPPLLAISCRRGGPPRHSPVLLAVAVCREVANDAAAATAPTYLIDLTRRPEVLGRGGLGRLLQSAEITKVFHYGVDDASELTAAFALGHWRRICDIGLAFEALLVRSGLPRRRVSLRALLQLSATAANSAAAGWMPLAEENSSGHAYWQRRPLTLQMATEAAAAARAALIVYGIGCRLEAAWGAPMPDLAACRRYTTPAQNGATLTKPKMRKSEAKAEPPLLLRLMADECGGAAAVAADCQPVARKLPFGILK